MRYYKVTFINKQLGKKVEITVPSDTKAGAIYSATQDIGVCSEYRCPELFKINFIKGAEQIGEPIYVKDYAKELSRAITKDNWEVCPKCGGGAFIPKFVQWHGGVCYSCGGLGKRLKNGGTTYVISDLEED